MTLVLEECLFRPDAFQKVCQENVDGIFLIKRIIFMLHYDIFVVTYLSVDSLGCLSIGFFAHMLLCLVDIIIFLKD